MKYFFLDASPWSPVFSTDQDWVIRPPLVAQGIANKEEWDGHCKLRATMIYDQGLKFQILLSRKKGGEWLLDRQQMSTTITFGICFPLGHNWQWDSASVSGSFPSRFRFPCHPGQLSSVSEPSDGPIAREIWV